MSPESGVGEAGLDEVDVAGSVPMAGWSVDGFPLEEGWSVEDWSAKGFLLEEGKSVAERGWSAERFLLEEPSPASEAASLKSSAC